MTWAGHFEVVGLVKRFMAQRYGNDWQFGIGSVVTIAGRSQWWC